MTPRPRRPRLVAAVLGAVAALGCASGPASAADAWVTTGPTLLVAGHGFGHGHGLSQYGARGAARAGLSATRILDFYYPGTTTGRVTGALKVLLTADDDRTLTVVRQRGLRLRDLGAGTVVDLPDTDVRRWRLRVVGSRTVLDRYDATTLAWTPVELATGRYLAGDGQFESTSRLVRVALPGLGTRLYRGALRHTSPAPGSTERGTVNVLSLDDYVKGVVPAEMPASWEPAAVQAQAVAARTYAAFSRDEFRTRWYQICDTTACQVYRGTAGEDPRGTAAVTATSRQVRLADGVPAFAQFSSSSGGWTSAGSRAYLPAQADPYDDTPGNPNHTWSVRVDRSRLEKAFPALGTLQRLRVVSRDGHGQWGGRVQQVALDGSRADLTVTGDQVRFALGLRSSWFLVS